MIDDGKFNLDVRRLMKRFGVGAQREIEKAVREAVAAGSLRGDETLEASVTLSLPALDLRFEIEDTLSLS